MTIGKRLAVGFDSTAWLGAGAFFHTQTLWVDFFGFYLNVYMGRVQKAKDPEYCESCQGPCRDEDS